MPTSPPDDIFDLLVVGGGVNGCGIARDAVGRGLSVLLCEMGDLAQATSSASTKLFHGGLRYLEHYEFRLVREALIEREVLWRNMPHIAWPMRFVLPHHRGLRPFWLIRLGLFLYDHLGGRRRSLPGTSTLDLSCDVAGADLLPDYVRGFEYSDCWVDDARLVVLNARDAADRGAAIRTRTRLERAWRDQDIWQADLLDVTTGHTSTVRARALVNAAGPWAADVGAERLPIQSSAPKLRLVRGSHIVTHRLFDHDRCYVLQNADGRIVFAIPYEKDFTLIGTTDRDHQGGILDARCTAEETDYLLSVIATYFRKPLDSGAIVHSFAGVRPLFDAGEGAASAASREYALILDAPGKSAPLLNVLGGKITTYRHLADAALHRLRAYFPQMGPGWTADAPLPGGDFPVAGKAEGIAQLRRDYLFLSEAWAERLWRSYGTLANRVLGPAQVSAELGESFGETLTEREVEWLVRYEWARTADDILWRRSKLGLRFSPMQKERLNRWLQSRL